MIRWFRGRRPVAPEPQRVTTRADITVAHAWGLTLTEWWALDDMARALCRDNVTQAPKFGATS